MMHSKIANVLSQKGSVVYSVNADTTVDVAVERMTTLHVGALLVLDELGPVGILNERDVLRRIVYAGREASETPVRTVMTPNPLAVKPTANVAETMRAMTIHRCRHLPVVRDQQVVGMVSIGDLTAWVTHALEEQVSEFARYIHGQYISDSVAPPAGKQPEIVHHNLDSVMAL